MSLIRDLGGVAGAIGGASVAGPDMPNVLIGALLGGAFGFVSGYLIENIAVGASGQSIPLFGYPML